MKLPWFVRGDLDGFFGLFIDNLLQLMLISFLGAVVCGFDAALITGRILPGAALSILLGNIFYAWQARRLAQKLGRDDITALPYGINTPTVFAFILLIMGPIYRETGDATLAWQAGLFACLLSGVVEAGGAFVGDWLRRVTPRAALLSALAGIAITLISMFFIFQIFASPLIAILPMMFILITYGARLRLPLGLPGGLLAVAAGTLIAWLLIAFGQPSFSRPPMPDSFGVHVPLPVFGDAFALLTSEYGWKYLAVIIPMALFNVVGSLQNLESAEAAGDRFETRPSLLANGVGSIVAALFGSAFPTTIYIGHPGWKDMGARHGYSVVNGIVVAVLCLLGGVAWIQQVVPLEATLGILLWIAIIITAQAFKQVPKSHTLAVAIGLIPSLGAWALVLIESTLGSLGTNLMDSVDKFQPPIYIGGLIALSQGYLLTSMILSAVMVYIVERDFMRAAFWMGSGAVLSTVGLIHTWELTPGGAVPVLGIWVAWKFTLAYGLSTLILAGLHFWKQK